MPAVLEGVYIYICFIHLKWQMLTCLTSSQQPNEVRNWQCGNHLAVDRSVTNQSEADWIYNTKRTRRTLVGIPPNTTHNKGKQSVAVKINMLESPLLWMST